MKKIFVTMLVPLLFVGFSYDMDAQTVLVTVSDAGTTAANGGYIDYGSLILGKRIYYQPSTWCILYWDTANSINKWTINDGGDPPTIYYRSTWNSQHPPQGGWEVVDGASGPPTLSGTDADPQNITVSGGGSPGTNGNYPYDSQLDGRYSYFNSSSSYRIRWYNASSAWKLQDQYSSVLYINTHNSALPPAGGWARVTGLPDPPTLSGGCDAWVPVELTLFTASIKGTTAQLRWSTATEVNSYGFDVERRTVRSPASTNVQSTNWTKIGFVQANGTSNSLHNYSYADRNLAGGTYAYRLKQIDKDGGFKYLQEMEVTVEAPKVFSLAQNYPDPFNPTTTIQFTVPSDGRATLKVFNVLGQEVATLFDGVAAAGEYHRATFDASRLASGIYFSRLEFDGKMQLKKMVLLK